MRNFLLGTAITYLAVTPQGNNLVRKGASISGKLANNYLKANGIDFFKMLADEEKGSDVNEPNNHEHL